MPKPDAIVVGDQAEPVYAANQFYQSPRPRSYFNSSTGYGEIKNFMIERRIPTIGVDLFTPDFVALAKALGCKVSRPENIEELESEIVASSTRSVPTLIEILADSRLAMTLAR